MTASAHVHIAIEVAQLEEWAAAAACKKKVTMKVHGSSKGMMAAASG